MDTPRDTNDFLVMDEVYRDFLSAIHSYRLIFCMNWLLRGKITSSERQLLLDELATYFIIKPDEVMDFIKPLENTIRYAMWNLARGWSAPDINQMGQPLHMMSPQAQKFYINSMQEIHDCLHWDWPSAVIKEVNGKTVLDFGCGSASFMPDLFNMGCSMYFGLDRKYVLDSKMFIENREGTARDVEIRIRDYINGYREYSLPLDGIPEDFTFAPFDNVLLSQVLHSKNDPEKYLKEEIYPYVRPGGNIFIVGMRNTGGIASCFNIQLLLHTGNPNRDCHRNLADGGRIFPLNEMFEVAIHKKP